MDSYNAWEGIDKVGFLQNIILLDITNRSQGEAFKQALPTNTESLDTSQNHESLSRHAICHFLDDVALVAAGSGSKKHICAVCIDKIGDTKIGTVRVAKNDGLSEEDVSFLTGLLRIVERSNSDGSRSLDQTRELVLAQVVRKCRPKIRAKVSKLKNILKQRALKVKSKRQIPVWSPGNHVTQSSKDKDILGPYSRETHEAHMKMCQERLEALEDALSSLRHPGTVEYVSDLAKLTGLAYDLRKSDSLKCYIQFNLEPLKGKKQAHLLHDRASEVVERIGSLSKFHRAAVNISVVGNQLAKIFHSLEVKAIQTETLQVPELRKLTCTQLQLAGTRFSQIPESIIRNRLDRWSRYRQHAEIQLLVFYEENPDLTPYTSYIGCSKLCCFLCYSFITVHAKFDVCGCHQSLYSLWTIRDRISFENEARASSFRAALQKVANEVERMFRQVQGINPALRKVAGGAESIANLSRSSINFSDITARTKESALRDPSRTISKAPSHKDDRFMVRTQEQTSSGYRPLIASTIVEIPETSEIDEHEEPVTTATPSISRIQSRSVSNTSAVSIENGNTLDTHPIQPSRINKFEKTVSYVSRSGSFKNLLSSQSGSKSEQPSSHYTRSSDFKSFQPNRKQTRSRRPIGYPIRNNKWSLNYLVVQRKYIVYRRKRSESSSNKALRERGSRSGHRQLFRPKRGRHSDAKNAFLLIQAEILKGLRNLL